MQPAILAQPPKAAHWQLIREAEVLIRDCVRIDPKTGISTPLCPEHFKKNIRKFLLNCMAEVQYISSWHWAIHCLRQGWCKYAPFRYFKMVLFHPRKHKLGEIKTYMTQLRKRQTFHWLLRTKGKAAAYTWANANDFAFNGYTVAERKAWQARTRAALAHEAQGRQWARDLEVARLLDVPVEEVPLIEDDARGTIDLAKLRRGSLIEFEKERAIRKQLEYEKGWRTESEQLLGLIPESGDS